MPWRGCLLGLIVLEVSCRFVAQWLFVYWFLLSGDEVGEILAVGGNLVLVTGHPGSA